MKSFKYILFLIVLLGFVVNSCQKPERDNPWDELANLDPEEWSPNSFSIAREDLVNSSLSWTYEDRNIEGFRIDRKAGDEAWQEAYAKLPKTARSWQDSLISPDTALSYQYRVFAYAGKNTSAPKTISYRPVFEAPSNLVLEKLSDLSYQLSWTNNTPWVAGDENEQGFKIDRQTGAGNWELAIATLPPSQTSWVDTNVFAGRESISLSYRIRAFYGYLESAPLLSSQQISLSKPYDFTLSQNSITSVSLNWQNNEQGTEGSVLERSYDEQNWEQLQKNKINAYQDDDFDLNHQVYYRLASYYGDYHSEFETKSFNAQIPLVDDFSYAVENSNAIILNWQYSHTGHEGFYLERQVNEGDWVVIASNIAPQTNAYEDNTVDLAQNKYAYRISVYAKGLYSDKLVINLPLLELVTEPITMLTHESATCGGNIISEGATAVTSRGIVWSSEPLPSIEQNEGVTNEGGGSGAFTSQLTGLSPASTYYVRAYAINSLGIGYGQQVFFNTTAGDLAQATILELSAIWSSTAKVNGIVSASVTPVSQRGICWSSSINPTIDDAHTNDGAGAGLFSSLLTGLEALTTYYVRAYAINQAGTAYGESLSFTTQADPCEGVISPAGFKVVGSSGKCWLDRNLGASRVAQSSSDNQAFGDLYQWGRLNDGHENKYSGLTEQLSNNDVPGHSDFVINDNFPYDWRSPQNDDLWQGVTGINNPCPQGYRLPTKAEWESEYQSWGSRNAAGAYNSPLKLPVAGYRFYMTGSLQDVGVSGHYWSTTVYDTKAWTLFFYDNNSSISIDERAYGSAVRCIKD